MAAVTAAAGERLPKSCSSVTFNTFSSQPALSLPLLSPSPRCRYLAHPQLLLPPCFNPDVQGWLTEATPLQGRLVKNSLTPVFVYVTQRQFFSLSLSDSAFDPSINNMR